MLFGERSIDTGQENGGTRTSKRSSLFLGNLYSLHFAMWRHELHSLHSHSLEFWFKTKKIN